MIANARMYSVCAQTATSWRTLLCTLIAKTQFNISVIEHSAPAPIADLWRRTDMAAVFMCGLPYSRSQPALSLIAAPVPSPPEFEGLPEYWSEWVVRKDSAFDRLEATFGGRLALTEPNSQSGFAAALESLMPHGGASTLYEEVIAPTVNPLGAVNAVLSGEADVAPVDAFAFFLLQKHRSDLTAVLRSVGRTARTPIPALVASIPGLGALSEAFSNAHLNPALRALMHELLVERFVHPDPRDYGALRVDFEAAKAFWRTHRLAKIVHPAFVV
jgi:hypothetical protein